jgi:uncharacterized membrane-anchored protein
MGVCAQQLAVLLCASMLAVASPSLAQEASNRSTVTVCAEAATSYAAQTEAYSDVIKQLMFDTRNNPAEQALRLDKLQNRHGDFKQTALPLEQERRVSLALNLKDAELDTQIKSWVIDNLLAFATDKYGQDKLFFKFYIVNRCKQQFAAP